MTSQIFVGTLAAILVAAGIIWFIHNGQESAKAEANYRKAMAHADNVIRIWNAVHHR